MSKLWIASALFCTGVVIACGGGSSGGSGVAGSTKLTALSAADLEKLCTYFVALSGPARTVDCGGGNTITITPDTKAECISGQAAFKAANPNCMATVDNAEACQEAFDAQTDAQICSETTPLPAVCAPLFAAECTNA